MRRAFWRFVWVLPIVMCARVRGGAEVPKEPLCISGVYPSLAALSQAKSECGIGAVVPWAGSLWFITYPAHYGDGKLYQVTPDLKLTQRPESNGGTHAGRLIHRESNQLIIGSYAIDARGKVRPYTIQARVTAVMRHLTDPKNKVYVFDMEGGFFELDVHTLAVSKLGVVQKLGVTGTHGKGGYTGQGRVVISNNGRGGALAEWDGTAERWTLVQHDKFTEVTGPGGILGAPDDLSPDVPLWAIGWDARSLILKVLDKGVWHTYRYPQSTYTHVPDHGWFTEWPRIREVGQGRFLLDFPSMFYEFPPDFRPGKTAGFRPLATHLRMVPDFCDWNGRLVIASDDTSVMGNPLGGQPQSNLWFGSLADLAKWGRPAGWGGPWVADAVKAGEPSTPYLCDGFEKRVLHLYHDATAPVEFTIEADAKGDGHWTKLHALAVPARGYASHIFPPDLAAVWLRLTASRDCKATAYFHYSTSGVARTPEAARLFQALPGLADRGTKADGVLLPANDRLWFLTADGALYEIGQDIAIKLRKPSPEDDLGNKAKALLAGATPKKGLAEKTYGDHAFGYDAASVIAKVRGKTFRLPRLDPAADATEGCRTLREVITERYLLNVGGLFYEVPRESFKGIRPVCAHGKRIYDYCTWRGLLVMSGALASAQPDGHLFRSPDGPGLWFGAVDDLWQLGKPQGQGGPWLKTPAKPGEPSDPYLMTGFDKKTLELSHDAPEPVTFTVEVDVLTSGDFVPYATLTVPSGGKVKHEFPDGYSAHWVRFAVSRPCAATAWLTYE